MNLGPLVLFVFTMNLTTAYASGKHCAHSVAPPIEGLLTNDQPPSVDPDRRAQLNQEFLDAAQSGETAHVAELLRAGAEVNHADSRGRTALIIAAISDRHALVESFLVMPGIDVNQADDDKRTALIWAARRGHMGIVELLLSAPGIDINHTDANGRNAYKIALHKRYMDIAIRLRKAGARL